MLPHPTHPLPDDFPLQLYPIQRQRVHARSLGRYQPANTRTVLHQRGSASHGRSAFDAIPLWCNGVGVPNCLRCVTSFRGQGGVSRQAGEGLGQVSEQHRASTAGAKYRAQHPHSGTELQNYSSSDKIAVFRRQGPVRQHQTCSPELVVASLDRSVKTNSNAALVTHPRTWCPKPQHLRGITVPRGARLRPPHSAALRCAFANVVAVRGHRGQPRCGRTRGLAAFPICLTAGAVTGCHTAAPGGIQVCIAVEGWLRAVRCQRVSADSPSPSCVHNCDTCTSGRPLSRTVLSFSDDDDLFILLRRRQLSSTPWQLQVTVTAVTCSDHTALLHTAVLHPAPGHVQVAVACVTPLRRLRLSQATPGLRQFAVAYAHLVPSTARFAHSLTGTAAGKAGFRPATLPAVPLFRWLLRASSRRGPVPSADTRAPLQAPRAGVCMDSTGWHWLPGVKMEDHHLLPLLAIGHGVQR
mmetsp:Transcript_50663/g.133509  ORF Transcript_50663/g.133509 Transcript_50663/m.133509 type:complete len:467 (+) Transcript_50663:47-1447(+)